MRHTLNSNQENLRTRTDVCMFQIHVHGNDLTSFSEKVPKESLPKEYGGKSGSISDNWGMI
jgi:hypothetical protein